MIVRQWDCRIAEEVVNVVKGTYCMNPKSPRNRPEPATAEDYVTIVKDADLDKAMDGASMAMINLLQEKRKLARLQHLRAGQHGRGACRIAPPAAGNDKTSALFVAEESLWLLPRGDGLRDRGVARGRIVPGATLACIVATFLASSATLAQKLRVDNQRPAILRAWQRP